MEMPSLSYKKLNVLKYKALLLACILLAPKLTNADTREQKGPYWIKKVKITNANKKEVRRQDVKKIKKLLATLSTKTPIYLSQQIPLFREICEALYKIGYDTTIKASILPGDIHLEIEIQIKRKLTIVTKIQWRNISSKEKKELDKLLNLHPNPNSIFDERYEEILENRLKTYYNRRGYLQAKIKIKQKKIKENKVKLTVKIKKGRKNYLKQVYFRKNHALTPRELHRQSNYVRPRLKNSQILLIAIFKNLVAGEFQQIFTDFKCFFIKRPVNLEKINADILKLKQAYQAKGYLDIELEHEIKKIKKGGYKLIITPKRGTQTQYVHGKINIKGNHTISSKQIMRWLGIKQGQPYNPNFLKEKLAPNKNNLYALFEKKNALLKGCTLVMKKISKNKITTDIIVEQIPIPNIKKIVIDKESTIDKDIIEHILKIAGLQKGKKITQGKLKIAQELFMNTSFAIEELTIMPKMLTPYTANLHCRIKTEPVLRIGDAELAFPNLKLGAEIANFSLKKLLQGKTPIGAGQKVAFNLRTNLKGLVNKKNKWDFSFNFDNPWIFWNKKLYSLGCKVYYTNESNIEKNNIKSYLSGIGTTIHFGRSWSGKKGRQYNYQTLISLCKKNYLNLMLIKGRNPQSGSQNTLKIESEYKDKQTNSFIYPTKGSIREFAVTTSFGLENRRTPELDPNYWRAIGHWRGFFTPKIGNKKSFTFKYSIASGISWATYKERNHVGLFFLHGAAFRTADILLDRHYVGLQGGDERRVPGGERNPNQFSQGGRIFLAQSLEVRYLLVPKQYTHLFVFANLGHLEHPGRAFSQKVAYGLGIRSKTPIGMLNLSLAWNLTEPRILFPKLYFKITPHAN